MFSITVLEFAYTQAPANMKSVLQAMNLMTTGIGNFMDITIMGSFKGVFSSQVSFMGGVKVPWKCLKSSMTLKLVSQSYILKNVNLMRELWTYSNT